MYSEVVVILVCIPKVWDVALGHLSQRGHFGNFVSISAHLVSILSYLVSHLSDLCPKMSIL